MNFSRYTMDNAECCPCCGKRIVVKKRVTPDDLIIEEKKYGKEWEVTSEFRKVYRKENLTEDQRKAFLENKGEYCPYCGGVHTRYTEMFAIFDDGTARQKAECFDCGGAWVEHYVLTDVSED